MDEHKPSATRYAKGCRCDDCRAAWRVYRRDYRRRLRAGERGEPRHGTESAYSDHGCRCGVCTDGHRVRANVYRANKRYAS